MVSSPLLLSLSSVFALLALAMLSIAFVTDNWQEFQVNRKEIVNQFNKNKTLADQYRDATNKDIRYYTRNAGLFHICFSDTLPSDVGSETKFNSPCIRRNAEYFPQSSIQELWDSAKIRALYILRVSAIGYILGLACVVLSLVIGIVACWRRSTKLVLFTAALMALGVLFCTLFIGGWFGLRYYETENNIENNMRLWPAHLRQATHAFVGWSMGVFVTGLLFLAVATIFMFAARFAIKKEEDKVLNMKANAYMMNNPYDKSSMMMPFCSTYSTGYPGYAGYPGYYTNQYPTMTSNYGYMSYGQ